MGKKKEAVNRSKTRASKATAQKEYALANKEVRRSVSREKKKFIEDLAHQAEEAAVKKQPEQPTKQPIPNYKKAHRQIQTRTGTQ